MKSLAFTLIATLLTPSMSFAQGGGPTWSAVHKWKPGAEATVTAHGIVGKRYFIAADDSGVTLLNVSYGVPAHVAKLLRHAAAEQPERFPVREGVTFVLDERASITSAGLFVAGQKIAEHDRIVERIQRNDVETGAVFLVVNKEWSITKQVLITLGVAVLSGISAMLIVCAARRCD